MEYKLAIADLVGVKVEGFTRDAAGDEQPYAFTLVCDRLDNGALKAAINDTGLTANTFFQKHARGWRDQVLVTDPAGTPASFSPEALEVLFRIAGMAAACWQAYVQQVVASTKN